MRSRNSNVTSLIIVAVEAFRHLSRNNDVSEGKESISAFLGFQNRPKTNRRKCGLRIPSTLVAEIVDSPKCSFLHSGEIGFISSYAKAWCCNSNENYWKMGSEIRRRRIEVQISQKNFLP